jgi:hypothetical protein
MFLYIDKHINHKYDFEYIYDQICHFCVLQDRQRIKLKTKLNLRKNISFVFSKMKIISIPTLNWCVKNNLHLSKFICFSFVYVREVNHEPGQNFFKLSNHFSYSSVSFPIHFLLIDLSNLLFCQTKSKRLMLKFVNIWIGLSRRSFRLPMSMRNMRYWFDINMSLFVWDLRMIIGHRRHRAFSIWICHRWILSV